MDLLLDYQAGECWKNRFLEFALETIRKNRHECGGVYLCLPVLILFAVQSEHIKLNESIGFKVIKAEEKPFLIPFLMGLGRHMSIS